VPGEAEVIWLNVLRTDASGRAVRLENFEVDRLDEALARLVELHADDELPLDRREERATTAAMFRNTQTRWQDDAVLVDHRPTSLGTLTGRDAIAHAAGALREVAGDWQRRFVDVIGATERLWLFEFVTEGTVEAGGPFELSVLALVEAGNDGLCRRQEWFAVDQIDEALVRFDELAGGTTADLPPNRAATVLDEIEDAIIRGDMAAYGIRTHENAVMDDRRFQYTWEGRDACVANARSVFTSGVTDIKAVNLATRGELLALRREWYRAPGSETEVLNLYEMTPSGQTLFGCVFEPDELDVAFAELDARYANGEGASNVETLEPIGQLLAAYNRQDWRAWRALLADDFVVVDHRPAPALYGAVSGPDEFTAALLPMFELAAGVHATVLSCEVGGAGRAVLRVHTNATTTDGAEIELAFYLAFAVDAGFVQRMEFFGIDQLAAGRAWLDTATTDAIDDGPSNAASRGWAHLMALFRERDWDAFATKVADGAVADDQRAIVGGIRFEGKGGFLDMWRSIAAIGVTDVSSMPIATRGDRCVALRALFTGATGEAEVLFAHEFSDAGIYAHGVCFDTHDRRAVFAQLDAYYAAQLPPERAEVWRLSTALTDLYNARNLVGLRDIFADDAVIVDERVTGWGELDRESFVDHLGELVGMSPDAFLACVDVYEVTAHGSAGRFGVTGTGPGGGEFELPFECVSTVRDGRLVRLELLPPRSMPARVRHDASD
jgi:ketosteroid isomerase-like protein